VGVQTGRLRPVMAGFACGSMILFSFFHKNLHFVQIFVKKDGFFRPAGGDMSFRVHDRATPVK